MKYYQVPARLRDRACRKANGQNTGYYLIAGELLTLAECRRIHAPVELLLPVEISRAKTYRCFGARFVVRAENGAE